MAASAQGARTDPQGLPVSTGASWTRTHLTAACHHRTQAASCKFGVASLSVGDSEWGLGPGRGAPQLSRPPLQSAASAIKPTQHRDAEPRLIDRRLACGLHPGFGAGIPVASPRGPGGPRPRPGPGRRKARPMLGQPGPLRGMGDAGVAPERQQTGPVAARPGTRGLSSVCGC